MCRSAHRKHHAAIDLKLIRNTVLVGFIIEYGKMHCKSKPNAPLRNATGKLTNESSIYLIRCQCFTVPTQRFLNVHVMVKNCR